MDLNNDNFPLYEAMKDYLENEYINYHTPGHCQGKFAAEELKKVLNENTLRADLTELPGLDNLYCPGSSIEKSERLAAKVFDADRTKYLVNGASSGIIASMLYAVEEKEEILIPRNAHRSVYNGLILTGALPKYIPLKSQADGFVLNVDPTALEDSLKIGQEKTLMLTNPTYYGVCLRGIKKLKKNADKNLLMIIDEAHGAHLNFCKDLIDGASKNEADIWIQSIHKNLGSLTQSGLLHWREDKIDSSKLKLMLQLNQTTSPSYVLMLSLEFARHNIETNSHLWDDLIDRVQKFRKLIAEELDSYQLLELDPESDYVLDLTKLTLFTDKLGVTGYKVAEILRKEFNILVELSSYNHILLFMTPAHDHEAFSHLFYALKEIAKKYKYNGKNLNKVVDNPGIPEYEISPAVAVKSRYKFLELDKSVGKISGGFITSYPPGIPLLVPGEKIEGKTIEYIKDIISLEGSTLEGVYKNEAQNNNIIKIIEAS